MSTILDVIQTIWLESGFAHLLDWRTVIMILLSFVLLYLGIKKQFEPLLLIGIAFGMLLTNLPGCTTPSCGIAFWRVRLATVPFYMTAVCWTSCTSA